MKIVHTIADSQNSTIQAKQAQKKIAFVPTMGNLHEGHLALVREARKNADFVVASIFVNPIQFVAGDDFHKYPRTFSDDCNQLTQLGVDLLFAPNIEEMYPKGLDMQTRVTVPAISDIHCGACRPGHFTGVATVVSKLFNIVQPNVALFGEKDYQQLCVIRQMVQDLFLPIEIIPIPTVRESDGLAMSSRNGYLSQEERKQAAQVYEVLVKMKDAVCSGYADYAALEQEGTLFLREAGLTPQYLSICRRSDLQNADPAKDNELVVLIAAFAGATRLIDNVIFDIP